MPKPTFEDRFWSKVDRRGPNDCWLWMAGKTQGYGYFNIGKRADGTKWGDRAHRVAFFLTYGRWPEPCCLHDCPGGDNPLCCNPAHLREGTRAENMADKTAKERQTRGEQCKSAKLREWQVPYIRALIASGVSQADAARAYGMAAPTVGHIARGAIWAHVSR